MQQSRFYKIIAMLIFLSALATESSFAQKDDKFLEKNLPDNSPQKTSETINGAAKEEKTPPAKTNASINEVKNSIADILLNKKAVSLMFNDEQNSNIDRAIESFKNKQALGSDEQDKNPDKNFENSATENSAKTYRHNAKSYIYLASIIYLSPTNWAVWINNQKITYDSNKKSNEIYLKSVERGKVKLFWTLSVSKWKILSGRLSEDFAPKINSQNQVEIQFELKPNQTFILSNNSVVEGYAFGILKKKEETKKAKLNDEEVKKVKDASDEKEAAPTKDVAAPDAPIETTIPVTAN